MATRSPLQMLLAVAAALAVVASGVAVERAPVDILGSYIAVQPCDSGIPAGLATPKGLDLQAAPGDGGPRARRRPLSEAPPTVAQAPVRPGRDIPPDGASARALARAGRCSAPGTAPPFPS